MLHQQFGNGHHLWAKNHSVSGREGTDGQTFIHCQKCIFPAGDITKARCYQAVIFTVPALCNVYYKFTTLT